MPVPQKLHDLTLVVLEGGEDDFTPQAFRQTFQYEALVRGGFNYTLNSSFAIMDTIKMHFDNINFDKTRERALTTGGYGQFCSKTAQFLNLS